MRYAGFLLCSDNCDSDSDSDSDSDNGWLRLNLWLHIMMAQNDWAGEHIDIRYAGFCLDRDSSDSDSINSDIDSDSVSPCFQFPILLHDGSKLPCLWVH